MLRKIILLFAFMIVACGAKAIIWNGSNEMLTQRNVSVEKASQGKVSDKKPLLWGDQGDGTYKNPVLNADYSDPDVIRVGGKYYMVASDFHYMGMPVLESEDMVNWRIISHVYDRLDYPGWEGNNHFGDGAWAPAIRYHDGKFWVFFCTYDEGLFMSNATDPHGPWTPLHCVKAVPKWEDPCPFWDDDGQAYLGRSRWRAGPIIIHRMSSDGKQLLDDGVTVYEGPVAEGTKIYKIDGFYYIVIPEGGVGEGWQTVLRSKNIYGPYERKIVLEQGTTAINGPHQGALVDTPSGEWWFYHFQSTSPAGRVVHLQPVKWENGWPLPGIDYDGNGIGEPVMQYRKPHPETSAELPQTKSGEHPEASDELPKTSEGLVGLPQTSDDFSSGKLYWRGSKQSPLSLQWQWNHNPHDSCWSLADRPGYLTLYAMQADSLKKAHNMLTQKTMGYVSEATTSLDFSGLREGVRAGLLCTGKYFFGIGVTVVGGKRMLYVENGGHTDLLAELSGSTLLLRVSVNSRDNVHQFSYSTDAITFHPVGQPFSQKPGGWKGTRVGLYCYSTLPITTASSPIPAYFDFFDYQIKE